MDNLISVQNITFEYETEDSTNVVLKDFSVDFSRGEFTAVLGHNGSGKSTLAKLLNGLLVPKCGKVMVNGIDTSDEQCSIDVKRTVGMVFQNPDNQLVATVVEEDVAFGLENLGVAHDEMVKRVDEALEAVGMIDFKNKAPHNLSGGQKQRVAIAGIIAMQPECIVLDEATAMLDPIGRREVINLIKKLNKENNITIVHITHHMDEVSQADRVILIDNGIVLADTTPRKLFSDVNLVKNAGLEVPQITALMYNLRQKGIDVPQDIITEEEGMLVLIELLKKGGAC